MHRTDIPRSVLDDGRPLQAGDAFEIDMRTGNARRVSLDEMPPAVAEQVKRIQGIVDQDEEFCESCGGPCTGFSVPGGDPLKHFAKVCEVANLPMPDDIEQVLEILHIMETADRLRDADRIVRERALIAEQQKVEDYLAGREAAQRGSDQPVTLGQLFAKLFGLKPTASSPTDPGPSEHVRKRTRTNAPGERAPEVPAATNGTEYPGHTLVLTDVQGGPRHAFWSETISGTVDLVAAHLREHLTPDTLALTISVHKGRVEA